MRQMDLFMDESMLFERLCSLHYLEKALFLLGGNREKISDFLNLPKGTFLSFLPRFHRQGIKALRDQREKPDRLGNFQAPPKNLEIVYGERKIVIQVSSHKNRLEIDPSNSLQFKTLMLSFMSSGFLSTKEVSEQLGVSQRHIRDLNKNPDLHDIEALIDKRRGQQKEYAFTEEIKAEIIQQFVVNLVNKKPTAGSQIADQVNEACRTSLSDRAMRQHLFKLGLPKIKESLPKLLEGKKKLKILIRESRLGTVLKATIGKKASRSQKKRVFERRQMITLHHAGISVAEIAFFIGRHISTVRRWIIRMTIGEDLCDRQRSGRPTRFSPLVQPK